MTIYGGKHYNVRLALDALGMAYFVILGAIALGSLVLDIKYWGVSGLVLGRLLNRNDGGGIHTLATLGVMFPTFRWARKMGLNVGMAAAASQLTDYYHEGIWNLPYYLYYHMRLDQIPYYGFMALACLVFYGTIVYSKREHNFRHLLYLLPWVAMITLYLLLVHHYSEDLFGPQSYYNNVWVNAYEILEVNIFSWSLYFGMVAKKDGHPVLATVYSVPIQNAQKLAPTVKAGRNTVTEFLRYASQQTILWVILLLLMVSYLALRVNV
jgi:hypothetical protein